MSLRGDRLPYLHEIHLRRSLWRFLPSALGPSSAPLDFGQRFCDAHFMLNQVSPEDCPRTPHASQTVDINRPPILERRLDSLLNLAHPLGRWRIQIGDRQTLVN